MKYTIIIIAVIAAIYAGCGENPTNNNPGYNTFQGNYRATVYDGIGFQFLYSFEFSIHNNGTLVNLTIGDSLSGITAIFNGSITNDTTISFSSVVNYMNTNFVNVITGNMVDSNGYHYLAGNIKLYGNIIGTFEYNFNLNNYQAGIFNTPGLMRKFAITKLN
jgi:hypothetical protein